MQRAALAQAVGCSVFNGVWFAYVWGDTGRNNACGKGRHLVKQYMWEGETSNHCASADVISWACVLSLGKEIDSRRLYLCLVRD